LPLETQAKLLRVLQEGQFERLGSSTTMNVDVRIIAATNRNLDKAVEEGRFRNDLWYRLNVFPITSPPLRRRKEDIPLLVNWLVDKYSRQMGKKIDNISGHTMEALESYSWPGNVRELENVIERAVISTQGNVLDVEDMLQTNQTKISPTVGEKPISEIERSYILETLEQTRWRIEGKSGAAKILGLTPSSLRRRMAKYNIQRP
jgi:formate hydrogenlyase transcriptional activator